MKDKILVYSIGISVLAHLVIAAFLGHASGLEIATASILPLPKTISVDLVANPNDAFKPQPKPIAQKFAPNQPQDTYTPADEYQAHTSGHAPQPMYTPSAPRPEASHAVGTPGGELNYGSSGSNGDRSGDWNGGSTPTGWVSNNSGGEGKGSGTGAGEGTPEPPKPVIEPPVVKPTPPPAPRMVTAKVCDESGKLAGENCRRTHTGTFIDGEQPTRKCTQCKAPEPEPVHNSRLADRANPELIRDMKLDPDEDWFGEVVIEYTVTADGEVDGARVARSSGNRAFDKAALKAASSLKYKPAVQDGVARSVKMSRRYEVK